MKISDAGLVEIASHEGIVLSPYKDSVGVWTFGIGHTAAAGPPDPAQLPKGVEQPLERALATFRADLKRFEDRVNRLVKVPLRQHEFDALVSFDFNTGGLEYVKNGKKLHAVLLDRLNAGDRAGAAQAFMGWSKPREIIPRRQKEQRLFRDGVYSNDGYVTVYPADSAGRVLWSKARRVKASDLFGAGSPAAETPPPVAPAPTGFARLIAAIVAFLSRLFGGSK